MPIPVEYANRPLYHFTHIENLPGILKYGILSTNEMHHRGIAHKNVAYDNIQDRRSVMEVLCGCGGVVHDYVPLYFCKRSPMLYAILQRGIIDQKQIIYLEFPIQILEQYQSVFTDGENAQTSGSHIVPILESLGVNGSEPQSPTTKSSTLTAFSEETKPCSFETASERMNKEKSCI
jgi:hypothetical protein